MGRRAAESYPPCVSSHHATCARIVGVAILLAAGPSSAQERGTIELGPFVGYNSFAASYSMRSALGLGARIGAYLGHRVGFELETNVGTASRPNGLADRSFRFLGARLLLVPVQVERMSVLLGAGGGRIDADIDASADDQTYAMHALVGGRIALSRNAALRLDYTRYFSGTEQHGSLNAGLSLFRHPVASSPHALPLGVTP